MGETCWIAWNPLANLSEKFSLDSMRYTSGELIMMLFVSIDERAKIKITFPTGSVYFFNNDAEVARLSELTDIRTTYGEAMYRRTFFEIINSGLIKEIVEGRYLKMPPSQLRHFCFIETQSVVDVIALHEPLVEWLTQENQKCLKNTLVASEDTVIDEHIGWRKIGTRKDGTLVLATNESASGWPSLIIRENYDEKGFLFTKIRYKKDLESK